MCVFALRQASSVLLITPFIIVLRTFTFWGETNLMLTASLPFAIKLAILCHL